MQEADRTADDQLGAADVEVVTAAACAVLKRPAGAAFAEVEPESGFLQAVQQWLVHLLDAIGDQLVRDLRQLKRHRHIDQVAIFERGAGAEIDAVIPLRRGFDVDHQGRAALHHRDPRPAAVQVLRDIVGAGAGAEHQHVALAPLSAIAELARMQHRSAKARERWNLRQIRRAADAGGQDDVARSHLAQAAVGQSHACRPAMRLRIEARAFERGAGPEIDFHRLDIGLQPVGELVLGQVERPAGGERNVGQVVTVHLVVQLQAVIAQPPVVADPFLAVDHQGIDAQLHQACGGGDAGMTAADDQHRRVAIGKGRRFAPLVLPVGSMKVAREGRLFAFRAQHRFLMALEFFQRGEQRPGHRRRRGNRVVRVEPETNKPRAAPAVGLETKYRLEHIDTGAFDHAWRATIRVNRKIACPARQACRPQASADLIAAADGFDVPGQGQQIAPVAVGEEQRLQAIRIALAYHKVETLEPNRDGLAGFVGERGFENIAQTLFGPRAFH